MLTFPFSTLRDKRRLTVTLPLEFSPLQHSNTIGFFLACLGKSSGLPYLNTWDEGVNLKTLILSFSITFYKDKTKIYINWVKRTVLYQSEPYML